MQLLLGDAEVEARHDTINQMREQAGTDGFACEIIDRKAIRDLLPGIEIGDGVSAASFSPDDGDVNPLKLLRAMHRGFARLGGRYHACCAVTDIAHRGGVFMAKTAGGNFIAPKIVLAAGHGISALAPMVGLCAPIRPQRGQILVTERVQRRLDMPVGSIRQTDEGGFQFGVSEEDLGFDDGTTLGVTRDIARRAIASFPQLASLRLLRSWGCIRVLTPDKCAVYDQSTSHPGAYVATSHSGVTLAAINAHHVAHWVADGAIPPGFAQFSAQRFNVPPTA
jgi:glycine/D-amino acid oxidase-like deaminating enzyme